MVDLLNSNTIQERDKLLVPAFLLRKKKALRDSEGLWSHCVIPLGLSSMVPPH